MNVTGDVVNGLGRGIMIGGLLTVVLTPISGGADARSRQADCTCTGLRWDIANDDSFVAIITGLG